LLPRANFAAEMRFAREKFDIVHSHSPFTLGMLGARWARRHDIPLVFTFHTLYHRYLHYVPAPHTWTRSGVVAWVRYYCGLCDHVLTPSRAVSHIVARLQPHVARSVLPTGIDVARFRSGNRQATRARLGLNENEVALLYVGRMVEEKNLIFLMRALAPLLRCEYSHARLLLVGGGPDFDDLQNVAHGLGIGERVVWTGFVDPQNTPDYYAAADVFVFASRTETQGLSIAEALAAGLPGVVVNAMGAAECLTDGEDGYVVAPHEDAFRAATQRLVCDSDLRKQMALAARRKAENLSRERRVDELLAIYQQLAQQRDGGA
jgi:1,2-diacylglycerol 3-alpha-glucosyltransferase